MSTPSREEFAPHSRGIREFTRIREMFAVEGWRLGDVVRQTVTKKKNLKRKREERPETGKKDEIKSKAQRINPFALGATQPMKSKVDSKPPKTDSTTDTLNTGADDAASSQPIISERQKARNKAEKRAQRKLEASLATEDPPTAKPLPISQVTLTTPVPGLTPLQQKMRAKLTGSQFRHINEKLYTTHSSEALSLFTEQPSLFHDYHQGFRHQVQSWPTNPIEVFISLLSTCLSKPGKTIKPHKTSSKASKHGDPLVVADLGCGDAALANHFKTTKGIKIHSFDLVKVNEFVEVCDMANVPLKDESVDVAVFCLSLMGTNFLGFLREACRYTKLNGEIWIAEIKSRFVDLSFKTFVDTLQRMGLKLLEMDKENKMFVIMRFEKISQDGVQDTGVGVDEGKLLKACLYKKR